MTDTNLISELAKPAPSRAVSTWIRDHEDECALASVTVGQLARGVSLKPLNSKRRLELEMSLTAIRVKPICKRPPLRFQWSVRCWHHSEAGGWRPRKPSSFRMARAKGRFMLRALTVARPVAVKPRTCSRSH